MTDEQQATPTPELAKVSQLPQPEAPPVTDEEKTKAAELIQVATESGSYLVAVFHVTEERKVRLDRVSRAFPMVDFDNCVKLLKDDLDGEKAGAIAQREAMPEVSPIAPVVDLFGKPPGSAE